MAVVRFATFNLENLFARPKVFNLETCPRSAPILKAFADFNALIENLDLHPGRQRLDDRAPARAEVPTRQRSRPA